MILTPHSDTKFINFLKKELLLTNCDIAVAVRKSRLDKGAATNAALAVWFS